MAENPELTKSEERPAGRSGGSGVLGVLLMPVLLIGGAAITVWLIGGSRIGGWMCGGQGFWSAVTISMIGAGTGSAALVVTWRKWPEYLPQGVLAAMVLRMFTTLAGILIFALMLGRLGLQFILLIVGFYALGLISETVIALKIARRDSGS